MLIRAQEGLESVSGINGWKYIVENECARGKSRICKALGAVLEPLLQS